MVDELPSEVWAGLGLCSLLLAHLPLNAFSKFIRENEVRGSEGYEKGEREWRER